MGDKLLIWDQGRSAYALTDAGRETLARIEDHFHCERQRELLAKLRGKPAPEDDAEPGTSGDVTPHIVRLYFNLVADAKSLAQTLGEVKQSLEFGGVTLEENLGKLLYCSSLEAEIGRVHTWICDLYGRVLDASRNQQRLLLQSAMAENAAEFASIAAVASKLALDCPQGGDFAGKLIAILYAVHSRGGGPFLPADAQDDGCGFREVAMTYARHRARDLRESIERDPSVDKIAQSLYNERRALGFLFRSKLMAREGAEWPTQRGETAANVGAWIYVSILDALAGEGSPPLCFSRASLRGGEGGDGEFWVLLPRQEKWPRSGSVPPVAGFPSGGGGPLEVEEAAVGRAVAEMEETWEGDGRRLLPFVTAYLRGLKGFANGASVAASGFPHSTTMKDLFALHSKAMHLVETTEKLSGLVASLAARAVREIDVDGESGVVAVVRVAPSPSGEASGLDECKRALLLVVAEVSDCLSGEIKTAAEGVFGEMGAGKTDPDAKTVCEAMLRPIFSALSGAHPATRRRFCLQAAVSVMHGVLLKMRGEPSRRRDGGANLADHLKRSLEAIESCLVDGEGDGDGGEGKPIGLLEMLRGDSNYHTYESSVLRSEVVMKLLLGDAASLDCTDAGLLPDLDEWGLAGKT